MNNLEPSEMAIQIIEQLHQLQSQLDAAKEYILSQPGAPNLAQLDRVLFDRQNPIPQDEASRKQYDEWKNAIQAKDDAQDMLRSLHGLVTGDTMTVPKD